MPRTHLLSTLPITQHPCSTMTFPTLDIMGTAVITARAGTAWDGLEDTSLDFNFPHFSAPHLQLHQNV